MIKDKGAEVSIFCQIKPSIGVTQQPSRPQLLSQPLAGLQSCKILIARGAQDHEEPAKARDAGQDLRTRTWVLFSYMPFSCEVQSFLGPVGTFQASI
jgi:hypothetical protein